MAVDTKDKWKKFERTEKNENIKLQDYTKVMGVYRTDIKKIEKKKKINKMKKIEKKWKKLKFKIN